MKYEYWFARIKGIKTEKKILLRKYMKTAKDVYYIEETRLKKFQFLNEKEQNKILQAGKQKNINEEYEKLCDAGVRFLPWFLDEYPQQLMQITDFPYALYVKGKIPEKDKKKVAVVGARKCTPYGEKYAVEFAQILAEHGIEIISGMARGIDGMGHRGALLGGGKTYAVLGSGPDVCYPREHIGLYVDILEQGGGILSEYPPGTPPYPAHFPARNRIISGLSDKILVMEAGEKSGSLITVDMALEQGRDVYALPGPINSRLSDGCNRLIRQGAGILISPEALLDEWGLLFCNGGLEETNKDKKKKMLETQENLVYSCLGLYPKNPDQISAETKMSVKEVLEQLVSLELQGYVREISKNQYISA